jgi:hypothetical protein
LPYKDEKQLLQEQFSNAHTLIGTQMLHAFFPVGSNRLKTKICSKCDKYREENISVNAEIDYENITGFVACDYD